jgi:hypothetical protein
VGVQELKKFLTCCHLETQLLLLCPAPQNQRGLLRLVSKERKKERWVLWLMPVTLATQEAAIRRMEI